MSGKAGTLRRSRRARPQREETPEGITTTPTKASSNAAFPEKLRLLLDEESTQLVDWLPTHDAFVIHDIDIFAVKVLPKYFRHSNLTSFQRQLNLYGFRRVTKGERKGAYHHPFFLRDRPELIDRVTRKQRKESSLSDGDSDAAMPLSTPSTPSTRKDQTKLVAAATTPTGLVAAFMPRSATVARGKMLHKVPSRSTLGPDAVKVSMPPVFDEEDYPVATSPRAMPHPTLRNVPYGLSPPPKGDAMIVPTPGSLVYLGRGGDLSRNPSFPRCASRNSDMGLIESYLESDMKDFFHEDVDLDHLDIDTVFSPPLPLHEASTIFH